MSSWNMGLLGAVGVTPPAYELISTQTANGVSSVTFSGLGSLASTYRHLQIRTVTRPTTNGQTEVMRFNGDTAANYRMSWTMGDGGSVLVNDDGAASNIRTITAVNSDAAGVYGVSIKDILDFASSSKQKTVRQLWGVNSNFNTPRIALGSGLWRSTSPITDITIALTSASTNFALSRISLYGIRG